MAQGGNWTQRMGRAREGMATALGTARREGARRRAWLVGGACALALAVGGWLLFGHGSGVVVERAEQAEAATTQAASEHGEAPPTSTTEPQEPQPSRVVTHVDGAVVAPGVYVLEQSDPRVNDAVAAAGGLAPGAQTDSINLAAPLADGAKVHVPYEGEEVAAPAVASAGATQGGDGAPAAQPEQSPLVNINSASEAELQTLAGIGPAKAQAIVAHRQEQGPFATPEDLMQVSGIGPSTFAKIKGQICV